jgi:predicted Zn-dependent protease
MDRAERERIALGAIGSANGAQFEAIVASEDFGLTRFTHNAVHQNAAEGDTQLRVRALVDGHSGVATTNALDEASVAAAVARALEIAHISPRDPDQPPMEAARPAVATAQAWSDATAHATPATRAALVKSIFEISKATGLWSAGYVRTSKSGLTVANSGGTLVSFDGTDADVKMKAVGPDSSGYAEVLSPDVAAVDTQAAARIAAKKAVDSRDPVAVEPGEWTVVLEPAAFGELLAYVLDHFTVQAVDEGRSFLSDGLGKRYLAPSVTIRDDYAHPLFSAAPFDFEGNPTQRVTLIENGIATALLSDAYWSRKLGVPNTGHALPQPSPVGPYPRAIVVDPGTVTGAELIGGVKRGLLVSRFWYIRTVDDKKTVVTGMTRDGTFLIEDGQIVRGVKNLRFNTSIAAALNAVTFSNEVARTGSDYYSAVVPTARVDGFNFTSTTQF